MSSNLPDDPIAQKLRDAAAQSEAQKAATTGEQLLSSDFARLAKQRRPAEQRNSTNYKCHSGGIKGPPAPIHS
jgi:hypothetical protein